MEIALGLVVVVTVLGLVAGGIGYQMISRRQELAQLDMLGGWHDISQIQNPLIKSTNKNVGSHLSLCREILQDKPYALPTKTITALFRVTRVMLRLCELDQIHLTRAVLNELKDVRAIMSDNVAVLQGLCIGPGRVVVMYAYCAKGTLTVREKHC